MISIFINKSFLKKSDRIEGEKNHLEKDKGNKLKNTPSQLHEIATVFY